MKTEIRTKILGLCRKAAISPARIEEIESGCSADRCVRIIGGELSAMQPGTLVLSDPAAAVKALDLAYDALYAR